MCEVVENFFGVYMLYNLSDRYKGRIYIGFTTDPNRRINQHNKGTKSGGARKTSNRGPWDMVVIVHGFPNEISALRFEWALQHPKKSRRLRHVDKKSGKEKSYDFTLRVLSEMLRVGPWNRMPLVIRWLNENYAKDFPVDRLPPIHMPIVFGAIVSKKVNAEDNDASTTPTEDRYKNCDVCERFLPKTDEMCCVNPCCSLRSHVTCLAGLFLKGNTDQLIPIDGECPACHANLLWGDLVRKKRGCYSNLTV